MTSLPDEAKLISYLSTVSEQDCGEPDPIENGHIQGNLHTEGAKITYICKRGYMIEGSRTRSCKNNKWTPVM